MNRPLGCQNADALAAVNEWLREYREVYPTSRLPELIIAFKIATTRTRRAAFVEATSSRRACSCRPALMGGLELIVVDR